MRLRDIEVGETYLVHTGGAYCEANTVVGRVVELGAPLVGGHPFAELDALIGRSSADDVKVHWDGVVYEYEHGGETRRDLVRCRDVLRPVDVLW
jgi:hypothetical protein